MTKVTYLLANGTVVYTYAQAKASGLPYTVRYEPIYEKRSYELTEKQKARLVIARG